MQKKGEEGFFHVYTWWWWCWCWCVLRKNLFSVKVPRFYLSGEREAFYMINLYLTEILERERKKKKEFVEGDIFLEFFNERSTVDNLHSDESIVWSWSARDRSNYGTAGSFLSLSLFFFFRSRGEF